MKDILIDIVNNKRLEVASHKEVVSSSNLISMIQECTHEPVSIRQSLAASPTGIIAEFKRKSPSKGWIHEDALPEIVSPDYEKAGASALSVLTDEKYFGGSLNYLRRVRELVHLPVLRKDFIIDEYQLLEARQAGADAVLLIAACLSQEECVRLAAKAHELGLETLLEIHSESELDYVTDEVDMVGVNNRNLGTFHTDVQNSFHLAGRLPEDKLLVSESGISDVETILQLREVGFRGFLIGETFMKEADPGQALELFLAQVKAAR